jgi:amidase
MLRCLLAGVIAAMLYAQNFVVEEATIAQAHEAMKAGRLTCRALVGQYLKRIAAYDKNGPAINSLILVNPDVDKQAEELDRRFAQSGPVGPLHCVPLIVKDNFETKGLQTTNGALAFAGYIPDRDAFQVKRVKDAGALVLAKSSMAEWAFSPYETVNSILPGYTKNPYALDRVTAGSSGGTAAAVAANLGLAGLGSDTGNSIRGPSSHQALAGIRSTMGLTSRAGVFPLSLQADIAGPMARTMEDAVRIFQVIVGDDPDDPVTASARGHLPQDFLAALDRDGLKGVTIAILKQAYLRDTTDPEIIQVFNVAVDDMRRAGAKIVDNVQIPLDARRPTEPCMGFQYDMNQFLAARKGLVKFQTLAEIIASNRFHPSAQRRLEVAAKDPANGPESAPCQANRAFREGFRNAVTKFMDEQKIDAFVYPTWSNPPRLIGDLNTPHGDNSQVFSPTTGFPATNIPMGYTRGGVLPVGMTFFGRAWSDASLIKYAFAYEQITRHRRPPVSAPPLH